MQPQKRRLDPPSPNLYVIARYDLAVVRVVSAISKAIQRTIEIDEDLAREQMSTAVRVGLFSLYKIAVSSLVVDPSKLQRPFGIVASALGIMRVNLAGYMVGVSSSLIRDQDAV